MTNIELYTAQSEEWKALRKQYITGTDLAAILDLTPFNTYEKWVNEKLSGESSFVDSYEAKCGRMLEASVIVGMSEFFNIDARPAAPHGQVAVVRHPNLPISVSLDGLAEERVPVECKHTKINSIVNYWWTQPPLYYVIQLMMQMECLDSDKGYIGGIGCSSEIGGAYLIGFQINKLLDRKMNSRIYTIINNVHSAMLTGNKQDLLAVERLNDAERGKLIDMMDRSIIKLERL